MCVCVCVYVCVYDVVCVCVCVWLRQREKLCWTNVKQLLFPQSGHSLGSSLLLFGSILAPWNGMGTVLESCLETVLRLANLHLKNISKVTQMSNSFTLSCFPGSTGSTVGAGSDLSEAVVHPHQFRRLPPFHADPSQVHSKADGKIVRLHKYKSEY